MGSKQVSKKNTERLKAYLAKVSKEEKKPEVKKKNRDTK